MLGVISFIFALGIIVLVHELGHFLVAKHYGILCHEFSIGMGPAVWRKRKGETIYSIRLIPIGGYVAMAGEEVEKDILKTGQLLGLTFNAEGQVDKLYLNPDKSDATIQGTLTAFDLYKALYVELEVEGVVTRYDVYEEALYVVDEKQQQQIAPYTRCLESKSKFARFATMAAGATMNFILALVLMFAVGMIQGEPQGEPIFFNELAEVVVGSPAEEAGLLVGDEIVDVNGTLTSTWQNVIDALAEANGSELTITVDRNGEYETVKVTPEKSADGRYLIGISSVVQMPEGKRSLGYGLQYAVEGTKEAFMMIVETFKMLFVTKEAGVDDLQGPVGIFTTTSQVVSYGFAPLLSWVAMLSVNIGVLNLLPLPALDGGRIIFVLIEAITRRPVNQKIEGYIHTVGLLMFMGLFIYVTFNDIVRLFQ